MEGMVEFFWGEYSHSITARHFGLHRRLYCGEILGRILGLDLHQTGDAILLNAILRGGAFFFTGEDVTLQAEEAWVEGRRFQVLREVGHFWWLGDGRGA